MKIAITGHRPNKLDNDYNLTSPLIQVIKLRILHEILMYKDLNLTLITGMALGIDTLFAQIAIEFKIPFIAAIPFKGQDRMWPNKSKEIYKELLYKATQIVIVDRGSTGSAEDLSTVNYHTYSTMPETAFTTAKMQARNMWMVNNCDLLIAVWDGSSGGTKNCLDYANSIGKQVIRINPREVC